MPKEYRLSYPCDLFVSVFAESSTEARRKLVEALTPLSDGVVVCLDHPKDWPDPAERLYPRFDGDGPHVSLVSLEDGPDDEDEDAEAGAPD